MAMTATGLKDKVIQELQTVTNYPDAGQNPFGAGTTFDDRALAAFCKAIVEYIQQNAVVLQDPDSDGDTEQNGTII